MSKKKQTRSYPLRFFNEENGNWCLLTDCLKTINGSLSQTCPLLIADLFTTIDQMSELMDASCVKLSLLLQGAYTPKNAINMAQRIRRSKDHYIKYMIHLRNCPRCLTVLLDPSITYYFTYGINLKELEQSQDDKNFVRKTIKKLLFKCCSFYVKIKNEKLVHKRAEIHQANKKYDAYYGEYKSRKNEVILDRCVNVNCEKYNSKDYDCTYTEKMVMKFLRKLVDDFDLSIIKAGLSKTIPTLMYNSSASDEENAGEDAVELNRSWFILKATETLKKQNKSALDNHDIAMIIIEMLSSLGCTRNDILRIAMAMIQIIAHKFLNENTDSDLQVSVPCDKKKRLVEKRKSSISGNFEDESVKIVKKPKLCDVQTTKQPLEQNESSKYATQNLQEVKTAVRKLDKFTGNQGVPENKYKDKSIDTVDSPERSSAENNDVPQIEMRQKKNNSVLEVTGGQKNERESSLDVTDDTTVILFLRFLTLLIE